MKRWMVILADGNLGGGCIGEVYKEFVLKKYVQAGKYRFIRK